MAGIKETQEVLNVVNALGVFIAKQLKDGWQIRDAQELATLLVNNTDFQQDLVQAFQGLPLVPIEVTDIDVIEGFQLGKQGVDIVNNIVAELRK